ncbi:ABC transporter G family member 21 [Vitis vinifera]|uniref:ABC transporter G family member 21 n=1 Tax=Vitis vinifera TaxID=29760 RepID=A0A438FYQ4_VITVI|nr:ABC transporter G family member 21 [Vitis vinifera]
MMPPEQETRITGDPANVLGANRIENVTIHAAEPASNVSPCLEDQTPDGQQTTRPQFSILRESLRPVTLKFEDVVYVIKLRSTEGSCFGSPEPSKVALCSMGGKTTLLTALAGRLPGKVSGNITYNGQPFSSSMKRKTGFVTQDDVLYPHLTVLETLTYAALLRLPKKLTREEKIEQAELIIVELGLTRCRNSVIGGPLLRGISGGERKRVSIGQEMLVNPSLLLLDEPTSGLDSTTAHRIVATLRGLAQGGRTVITTIHQPSSRLYRMFDKLVVLSEGCPIYSGNAANVLEYFGTIGYLPGFSLLNPADFLLDLANGVAPDVRKDDQQEFHGRPDHHDDQNSIKQALISSYKKNLYHIMRAEIHRNSHGSDGSASGPLSSRGCENQWTSSWWEQFKVLLRRGLLWWHSDTSHIQDQLVSYIPLLVVVVMDYGQVGLLFFFSIFWGFFPLFNAIFTFPQERPMLIRERSSGMYRLSSYYFARMAGDLPMELVLPTIFVTIAYWMGGLKPSLLTFVLTLLVILYNVLVSQGLGLALGAIIMDVKQGTALASVTMLVFLLAGGYYIQHIPPFIAWLKYISFSHYCYKLLVGVQYAENEVYECGLRMHCKVWEFPAIKYLGIDHWAWDVAALTVMFVGYRALAYAALRMGQHH